MTLEEKFIDAKQHIMTLGEKPSNDVLLKLYGLFKQGSQGDIDLEPPGIFDFVAKAKYNAWEQFKGIDPNVAKQQYIDLVNSLVKTASGEEQ